MDCKKCGSKSTIKVTKKNFGVGLHKILTVYICSNCSYETTEVIDIQDKQDNSPSK